MICLNLDPLEHCGFVNLTESASGSHPTQVRLGRKGAEREYLMKQPDGNWGKETGESENKARETVRQRSSERYRDYSKGKKKCS